MTQETKDEIRHVPAGHAPAGIVPILVIEQMVIQHHGRNVLDETMRCTFKHSSELKTQDGQRQIDRQTDRPTDRLTLQIDNNTLV